MKYVAVTFTDEKFSKTKERYVEELKSKNIFSKIYAFGNKDIYDEFLQYHQEFINNNPRGFGYFIWKPYVILKVLQTLDDGDILVYGDAGNTIPGSSRECLEKFDIVKTIKHGTKVLACKEGWNIRWIKTDLYFKVAWYAILYAFKFMPAANRIVIQKNNETISFVKKWMDLCTINYKNIDNSPSRLPNLPFFIEHRHDQGIFAILFHYYNCKRVDFGKVWLASRLKF
jgi:hypothetical protein